MNKKELEIYYNGVKDGIYKYSWWKHGIQYVGTTGKTLKEAHVEIQQQFESDLKKLLDKNDS